MGWPHIVSLCFYWQPYCVDRPPADTRIRHKLDTDCVTCTDPPTRHRGVTNYTSPAAGPGVGLGADGQRGDSSYWVSSTNSNGPELCTLPTHVTSRGKSSQRRSFALEVATLDSLWWTLSTIRECVLGGGNTGSYYQLNFEKDRH